MTLRPPTACSVPGCTEYATERGRCAAHAQSSPALANRKQYDKDRPFKHLYNMARWKGPNGLRLVVLRRDPICVECNRAAATIADHIIDHKGNLILFFDIKNLRGVCKPCHDRKTGASFGGAHGSTPIAPPTPALVGGLIRDYGEQFAHQPITARTIKINSNGDGQ